MAFLRGRRRASALIVAMGMLTVLALMAFTFAAMTRAERQVSANYTDFVRARMIASSGVERAVAALVASIDRDPGPGEKYSIAEGMASGWEYGQGAPQTSGYPDVSLEIARYPSFKEGVVQFPSMPNPGEVRIAGMTNEEGSDIFGASGMLPTTYNGGADFYSLSVQDSQGMVYVNCSDPLGYSGPPSGMEENFKRLLNNLGSNLYSEGRISFSDLADRVADCRSALGRPILLLEELVPYVGEENMEVLNKVLTAYAWVDMTTLDSSKIHHRPDRPNDPNIEYNPNGVIAYRDEPAPRGASVLALAEEETWFDPLLEGPLGFLESTLPSVRSGFSVLASCGSDRLVADDRGDYADHWDSDANNQEASSGAYVLGPMVQPRAPININTAPAAVLEAALQGIMAFHMTYDSNPVGFLGSGWTGNNYKIEMTAATAASVAQKIIARRAQLAGSRGYPFSTWSDWNDFVDTLSAGDLGVSAAKLDPMRQMLKAHANPNSQLNKFNPDSTVAARFGDVDKGDINQWTTEFCFRSLGFYRIESVGRVLAQPVIGSDAMRLRSEAKLRAGIKLYDVYRSTTQKDFERGKVTAEDVTTYPENLDDHVDPLVYEAEYDGCLMAAQSDTLPGSSNGASFFADYRQDFGPDAEGPAEQGVSLLNFGMGAQSELFVDGLFAHRTRRYNDYTSSQRKWGASAYNIIDDYVRNGKAGEDPKISMDEGTLEMWVKPTWRGGEFATNNTGGYNNPEVEASKVFFSMGEGKLGRDYATNLGPKDQSVSDNRVAVFARHQDGQTYIAAMVATRLSEGWGWGGAMTLPSAVEFDDLMSYWGWYHFNFVQIPITTASPIPWGNTDPRDWGIPGRWHHILVQWTGGSRTYLYVDGRGVGEGLVTGTRAISAKVDNDWSLFPGSNRFRKNLTNGYPCNADATIDDLRIYPFSKYSVGATNIDSQLPHRYIPDGTFRGRLTPAATGGGMPYSGKILNVAWTVQYPSLDSMSSQLSMELITSDGTMPLVPDAGIGTSLEGKGCRAGASGGPLLRVSQGGEVEFRVEFNMGPGSSGKEWYVASPILQDVTVAIVPDTGQQFFYYNYE